VSLIHSINSFGLVFSLAHVLILLHKLRNFMFCVLSWVKFLLVFGLFVCNVCTLCLLFCLLLKHIHF